MDKIEFSISSESKLVEDKISLDRFLKQQIKNDYDFEPIIIIFSELYMNICHHANSQKNSCSIFEPDTEGNMYIQFSDDGDGIVSKIKSYYTNVHFNSDADCIEFALKENVTTRSLINNKGAGLNILKSIVELLKGNLSIYCKFGLYENRGEQIVKSILDAEIKGTLIEVYLNINNLDKKEISDYSNDLEF